MSTIDNRVVGMKFEGNQFQRGASAALGTLQKLTDTIGRLGRDRSAAENIGKINKTASQFTGAPMVNETNRIGLGFVAMATVAATAISEVTRAVLSSATQIANSFTLTPITDGFKEYETQLNSTKTILANTQQAGTTLGDVQGALDDLNTFADQTIYNFTQMTQAIGKFTANGVDLERSVSAIKGLANATALGGGSAEDAARLYTQLSQAIAAGKVSAQDWNSVINSGAATAGFKKILVESAIAMGDLEKSQVKVLDKMGNMQIKGQSFKESIMSLPGQTSWLSSDVLLQSLEIFTADLSDAQLVARGFKEDQIEAVQAVAQAAFESATQVRTLTGVFDVAKESIGSGWSQTWRLVFGDLEEATKNFSGLAVAIGDVIHDITKRRNDVLQGWRDMGGNVVLIDAFKNAWKALGSVIAPIQEAFRNIFPAHTAQTLFELTERFRDFMKSMILSDETSDKLRRTFEGLFAVVHIFQTIVGNVVGLVFKLFTSFSTADGGLLDITASFGDLLVALDNFLTRSGKIESFFETFGTVLAIPLKLISMLTQGISNFVSAIDFDAAGDAIAEFFKGFATTAESADFSGVGTLIGTALVGGIFLTIRKMLKEIRNITSSFSDVIDTLTSPFEELTSTLQAMQTQLRVKTLVSIATAIALLAGSLFVLSKINAKDLARSLGALGLSMGYLLGAMVVLTKFMDGGSFIKLPILATALIGIASAVSILAVAMKIFATMSWEDIAKGMTGLVGSLVAVASAVQLFPKSFVFTAASLVILGVAINELAVALNIFALMSWEDIGRGIAALAGTLYTLAAAVATFPKSFVRTAASLVILGLALNEIAIAMKIFGSMSLEEIGRGLLALGGALAVIALALKFTPETLIAQAAALVLVAIALNGIATAMKIFGSMSLEEIGRGLVALGGSLVVLAIGLRAMGGTFKGAAALGLAAAGLALLAPVLITLGSVSWKTLLKGLGAIAGILLILGIAGAAIGSAVIPLLGLGAACLLLATAFSLAGLGMVSFANALKTLSELGSKNMDGLTKVFQAFADIIPDMFSKLGEGVINFVEYLTANVPKFIELIYRTLSGMIDTVIKLTPKFVNMLVVMARNGLRGIRAVFPDVVKTGFDLVIKLLDGIQKNMPKIIDKGANIIVAFLRGLGRNAPKIVNAGFEMIIDFIEGVTDSIEDEDHIQDLMDAGWDLAKAIVDGILDGFADLAGDIYDGAKGLGSKALDGLGDVLKINSPSKEGRKIGQFTGQGVALGMEDEFTRVETSARVLGRGAIAALSSSMAQANSMIQDSIGEPVIRPVMDLSKVKSDTNKMTQILGTGFTARVSTDQAEGLVQDAINAASLSTEEATTPGEINFTQINNSPKALDAIEIYRNTKSQIAKAREELDV